MSLSFEQRLIFALATYNVSQYQLQAALLGDATAIAAVKTGVAHTDTSAFESLTGNTSASITAGNGVVLTNGVSAFIPANVGLFVFICSASVAVPGAGNLTIDYRVLPTDVHVGLAITGGGFKITAVLADGTINVLDQSTDIGWILHNTTPVVAPPWRGGIP